MFVEHALDDKETGAAFADRLFQSEYGEDYGKERIDELVELDRQGLIDVEGAREDLGAVRQPTARERELQSKLDERDETIKQLTGESKDATSQTEKTLNDQLDRFVTSEAMKVVTPIVQKVGWVAAEGEEGAVAESKILHGEMVSAWIDLKVKQSPHYEAIQLLREQGNAFRGGEPTRQMRVAMDRLRDFSKATILRAVRTQQSMPYAKAFTGKQTPAPAKNGRSSNDTTARLVDAPPRAQTPAPKRLSAEEEIELLDRQYDAKVRDSKRY
jgi:hypothetical protein